MLLVIALALLLVLVPCVLARWRTPTVGLSFLLVVATESVAVLAARVGLVHEALVPLALGLAFYAFVLARFDLRQVLEGGGDHWIAGGALAIAALACARCGLHTLALAVWAAAADGVAIMNQRLIATSAVRCVGNTLLLQGRTYSPPFVITAIVDANAVRAQLAASPQVAVLEQAVAAFGLTLDVHAVSRVTLPAYTGSVDLQYATASPPTR